MSARGRRGGRVCDALVTTERGLWLIADRDGRNGTFVDGRRYPARMSLRPLYDPENRRIKG